MIRFIRSKENDLNECIKCYSDFLKWRLDNNIDEIRKDITNGKFAPHLFPNGKNILEKAYQIVITRKSRDNKNRPIALETFNFSFKDLAKAANSVDDYIKFIIYTFEYRSMVIEQLSREEEAKLLASVGGDESKLPVGYAVILQNICIRDLKGAHFSSFGTAREVLKKIISIGSNYYPEYMGRSIIINSPFLFNSIWVVIKQFLDEQ